MYMVQLQYFEIMCPCIPPQFPWLKPRLNCMHLRKGRRNILCNPQIATRGRPNGDLRKGRVDYDSWDLRIDSSMPLKSLNKHTCMRIYDNSELELIHNAMFEGIQPFYDWLNLMAEPGDHSFIFVPQGQPLGQLSHRNCSSTRLVCL